MHAERVLPSGAEERQQLLVGAQAQQRRRQWAGEGDRGGHCPLKRGGGGDGSVFSFVDSMRGAAAFRRHATDAPAAARCSCALAAPARAAGPEIGVADDRVLMAGGARGRPRGGGVARERGRRRADLRPVDADRALGLERARRLRGAGARRGHGADPHRRRAAHAAGQGEVRGLRGAGGGALRRRGRPLHRLERAQPPGVAAAAGGVLARALLAGRAAPLPRARARRPARDPGGRPRRRRC